MLQDYYEKHNLEMKPYQYYLAEFQNVNPEDVTSRLDIPFDDNSKSFIIKFMVIFSLCLKLFSQRGRLNRRK